MQELEKILEEFGSYICDELCYYRETSADKQDDEMEEICAGCKVGKYLESIRKHMNNGWIPVDKNNIPEDEILACDGYKNELIGYLRYNPDGEEFICESDECIMHQVTAWMPRPEPYRPERSEE